ncbi:hypothetical protein NP233_g5079 [Leucocoprinus birnbaumii]|uniref:UBA domain-containing protein n=1 Tax=Leucocoprinus birnbaumii TaxID=56174 RepID=A0AAD5VW67_9AGAR|nr:hypothetical protein NP233_g5079 [Leucocoprinus birnbaumii]
MSDSFADLWSSNSAQKKPQTLSSLAQQQPSGQAQRRPQGGQDLFALLSSSTSGPTANAARASPSIRSSTPSSTLTPTPPPSQRQQPQQRSTAADAFSDLFSSSASSSQQNLTIAQRTALADQNRKEAILANQKQQEKEKSAWAGLDSLGFGSNAGLTPTTANGSKTLATSVSKGFVDEDDWGLGDFGKSSTTASSRDKQNTASAAPASNADTWDFNNFGTNQTRPANAALAAGDRTPNTSSQGGGLWDLDEFTSPSSSTTTSISQTQQKRVDSSGEFDFGGREDGLLNGNDDEDIGGGGQGEDDDFMSVFNKPPEPKTNPSQRPSTSSSPRSSSSPASSRPQTQSRGASPPPHILGQVVEMGFSIPKAKAALVANNNDVQAALDQLLVSEGGYTGGSGAGGRGTPARNADSPAPTQAPHPRRRDRERETSQQQQRQQHRGETSSPSAAGNTGEIQAQAEQLLAQASEIGRGMFTKASLFWKEKKEQVQKAVEEHRSSSAASGASGANVGRPGSGRPKWMQQPTGEGDGDDTIVSPKSGSLEVDDGPSEREKESEVWVPKRPDRQRERERQRVKEREAAAAATPPPPAEEPEVDLFAPAPVTAQPQSNIFQTAAPPQAARRTQPSTSTSRSKQPSQPPKQLKSKYQRNTSTISSSIANLKSEANASFKLGQFGNAETIYTRAINSLRSSSSASSGGDTNNLYFVLLLNNRANARMKNGDVGGAVKDCDSVIGLVTMNRLIVSDGDFDALGRGGGGGSSASQDKIDWDPSYDANTTKFVISISGTSSDVQEETVDLVDGLTKAIKRRAEAYEGLEKWNKAKNDWELLRGCGWIRNEGIRGEAGRGVGRCVRMTGGGAASNGGVNGSSASTSSTSNTRPPPPRPKPKPRPATSTPRNPDQPSSALNALRNTNAAAEAEDQAKHELKDFVDARLANWKNGKESNIRALLASLDTVLWEELVKAGGGVKVGMHELVTPGQVKIKYMKAVAKVHPDKLNASNSTLEQRMIAQGVFGALNEAWNAFKQ